MRSSLNRSRSTWGVFTCALALGAGCGRTADETPVDGAGSPSTGDAAEMASGTGVSEACGDGGVARGNITVTTQAALDGLRGCQRIEGSLTLRLAAGTDTSPLGALRTVTGQLAVAGQGDHDRLALDGFRGLEVAGGLALGNLTLDDLSGFSSLTTLLPAPEPELPVTGLELPEEDPSSPNGMLSLYTCEGLTSLGGLDALERVTTIAVDSNPQLTSLAGAPSLQGVSTLYSSNCPLADLGGLDTSGLHEVSITGSQLTNLLDLGTPSALQRLTLSDNPRLAQLTGWQPPSRLELLQLSNNPALEDARGLETLRDVGYLELSGSAPPESGFVSFTGLEGLQTAKTIRIHGPSRFQHLTGLDGLREANDVQIFDNPALTDLAGLSALTTVRSMALNLNTALASLVGVGAATFEDFQIGDATLTDLRGLQQATITLELALGRLEHLDSLDGLPHLAPAASLVITESPSLEHLEALEALSELGLVALQGTGVAQLDGLVNLRRLGGLQLDDNPRLEQIDALGALETLGGIRINHSPLLRALPVFASIAAPCAGCQNFSLEMSANATLERVGPWPWLENASTVYVGDNPALTSVSLGALLSAEDVVIENNTSLSDLVLPALAQPGRLEIEGNPGIDAVIRDCATGIGSYRNCTSP